MNEHGRPVTRGMSTLSTLLTVLVFLCALYAGFKIVPFFYYESELLGLMQSQADKAQVFNDGEIRKNVITKIKELQIPADPDDLQINRYEGKIVIEIEYEEVFYVDLSFLPWIEGEGIYDVWVFKFHPKAEADV